MKLKNVSINQWEQKCNSDGSSAVELNIRADIVKDDSPSTFCNPDVRRDFEHYISKYEYGDGLVGGEKTKSELFQELCKLRKELSDAKCENASLKEKVKDLELLFGSELKISNKLREDVNALCDDKAELQKDLEELKDILRIDLDAGREEILYRIEEVVSDASECKDTRLALMNVYNACLPAKMNLAADATVMDISKEIVRVITNKEKLRNMDAAILGDFLSFRDKIKKMVGCESNECSEILDILKRHLEDKKELSGKLEMFCRFRDDVMATFGIKSYDGSDILYELSRAALLAEKTEFICGYFDVKQIPLTSLAENLCLEIKENVISEYKTEVESKRQEAIRDAANKAGSVGNGVYLDGLTVEQNLRAENARLKAEREKYKEYISKLENSLDCIYNEASAVLGYE